MRKERITIPVKVLDLNTGQVDWLPKNPRTWTEDDFDENDAEIHVRCKPGDVWELGPHRLMCGDSTDLQTVKALMGGG